MKDATVRATGHPDSEPPQSVTLRLYVARTTPNSRRAEQNLMTALKQFEVGGRPVWRLEVVDVFTTPKRAIKDGIIVTPTLIALGVGERFTMIGDLSDADKLMTLLHSLFETAVS